MDFQEFDTRSTQNSKRKAAVFQLSRENPYLIAGLLERNGAARNFLMQRFLEQLLI